MKSNWKLSMDQCMEWEGGTFTDDPDDRGGATKWGVIQERYNQYRKAQGKAVQSVRYITIAERDAIYKHYYWDEVQGDLLPAPVDTVVFDAGVNHGPARAAKWLQAMVGATPDGNIGPATIVAVDAFCKAKGEAIGGDASVGARILATRFCDRREDFYEDIAVGRQVKFLKGWMNRLQDLRKLFGLKDTDGIK